MMMDDEFLKNEEEDIDLDAIDLLEGIGTEDPVRMYLKEIGTVPLPKRGGGDPPCKAQSRG